MPDVSFFESTKFENNSFQSRMFEFSQKNSSFKLALKSEMCLECFGDIILKDLNKFPTP
jgi:hypothetical protein